MVKTAKTALPANLSLVSSTHIRWLTTTRNFSFGDPTLLLVSEGT